jgi:hypothetical protein
MASLASIRARLGDIAEAAAATTVPTIARSDGSEEVVAGGRRDEGALTALADGNPAKRS